MSVEQIPCPFIELYEFNVFYRLAQSSFSTDTSYAPKWNNKNFVI